MAIKTSSKNLIRLVLGQLCAQTCDRMTSLGLIWVLSEKFGNHVIPWYLACCGLPHVFVTFASARVIERFGAQRVVIAADAIRALLFVMVSGISVFGSNTLPVSLFFALGFCVNVAAAFFNPAIFTLPLQWQESADVQKANSLLNACFSAAPVFGPLVAMLLYARFQLQGVFVVTAAAYALATLLSCQLKFSHSTSNTAMVGEVPSLKNVFFADRAIAIMLMAFFFMNLFLAPLQMALPIYSKDIYGGDIHAMATLEACMGVGMISGSLILSFRRFKANPRLHVPLSLFLTSLFFAAFVLSSQLALGALLLYFFGAALGFANVAILNLFQTRPVASHVSSVMTLVNFISVAAVPFSMMLVGGFVEHFAVQSLMLCCALALIVVVIMTSLQMRRLLISEVPNELHVT